MLAAAQRLRRREDFAATIRNGRRAGRGALVVHFLNPGLSQPGVAPFEGDARSEDGAGTHAEGAGARAGFVVSRAVGNAVVRNAVKRRLRHLVRPRLAELPEGSVIVVRALPEAARVGYHALEQDLDAALQAARRPKSRGERR
ncbi:ribonuclease P protein component [Dactylosporangium sp. CA-139066]|uniref:ribonuclease P protein component n=1 Tax=Dactylosporangium sp. CA-139066 TaxID=3239930 RepID=UPI003D8BA2F1